MLMPAGGFGLIRMGDGSGMFHSRSHPCGTMQDTLGLNQDRQSVGISCASGATNSISGASHFSGTWSRVMFAARLIRRCCLCPWMS